MKKIQTALIMLIALVELLKGTMNMDLSVFSFFIASLLLIVSIKDVSESFQKPVVLFLAIGILLLVYSDASAEIWISAITSMLNIIAILVIMQLFSIPIKLGDYGSSVETVLRRFSHLPLTLFAIVSLLTNIFGSFLLFGTIPVMLSLVKDAAFKFINQPERFISNAITRSYALVVLWTPTAVNIVLVSAVTGASWLQIVVPGICISLIGLTISGVLEKRNVKLYSKIIAPTDAGMIDKEQYKKATCKIYYIVFVVTCLIGLVAYFGYSHIASNNAQVMLAGLIMVSVWMIAHYNSPHMFMCWQNYFSKDVLKMLDLSIMFIAISVFSQGMKTAGILELLLPVLGKLYMTIDILVIVVISILIVVLAYVGVHPFAAMVVIGEMVSSMSWSIPPVIIALTILLGASVSYVLSPFAGMVLTMSKFMNISAMTVSLKWNGLFSCLYFIVGMLFIYLYWYVIL